MKLVRQSEQASWHRKAKIRSPEAVELAAVLQELGETSLDFFFESWEEVAGRGPYVSNSTDPNMEARGHRCSQLGRGSSKASVGEETWVGGGGWTQREARYLSAWVLLLQW